MTATVEVLLSYASATQQGSTQQGSTQQSPNAIFVHYIPQEQSFRGKYYLEALNLSGMTALLGLHDSPLPPAPSALPAPAATLTSPSSANEANSKVDMEDVGNIPPPLMPLPRPRSSMFLGVTVREYAFGRAFKTFIHGRMSNSPSNWIGLATDDGIREAGNRNSAPSRPPPYPVWFTEGLKNHWDSILESQSTVERRITAGLLEAMDQADVQAAAGEASASAGTEASLKGTAGVFFWGQKCPYFSISWGL